MAPKAHAILSPSAAARWLKCPASVAMTASMPEETSPYALEGSIAHAVAESVVTGEPYRAPEGADRIARRPDGGGKALYRPCSAGGRRRRRLRGGAPS